MAELLVVDDDPDAAEALVDVMRMEGHHVRVAYNGAEGLRALRERAPDALVLDVDMPVLDGPGVALSMFVFDAGLEKVPIVLLSGVPDLRAVASQVGTPYFLSKPCRYEQLVAMINQALTHREAPRRA